jgi:methionine synthase II (cobalamin-independent)
MPGKVILAPRLLQSDKIMKKQTAITPETSIEEIVEKHPELVRPLREYGIACIRCGEPIWGTLKEIASEKGIHNIDDIVQKLNTIIS